jgi:hypothetical protein
MRLLLLLLLTLAAGQAHSLYAQGSQATLQGTVRDELTREPLEGAQVLVVEAQKGALTDSAGRFAIRDLAPGTYSVRVQMIGYADLTLYEVRVQTGGNTPLTLDVRPTAETQEVVINAQVFSRSSQELVSTRSIGLEQIQSNPGGNLDISRALTSLPGVGAAPGFRNDLIIRGGAPNENVYYLDGVEVPNINHFATQGSGGGPQGMIPSNLIQRVSFQTSGFRAQYDNTLSSVLDFELAPGNSERFQTQLTVSGTEAGVQFDTPIGRRVTALFSARRSYLQLLFKGIGLPFLPSYWDFAAKVQVQLSPKDQLTYIGIGAIDDFTRNRPADATEEQLTILDGLPTIVQRSYTQGLVWRHLLPKGFFTVTASRNELRNDVERYRPFVEPQQTILDYASTEAENKLRLNLVQRWGRWEFTAGAVVQVAQFQAATQGLLLVPVFAPDTAYALEAPLQASGSLTFARYGAHVALSRDWAGGRLRSTLGLRTDMNTFTDKGANPLEALSPRLLLSYALSGKVSVNASTGIYYKLPSYTLLGYAENGTYVNRSLRYIPSTHAVLGLEWQPTPTLLASVEGFYKLYDRYPVSLRSGLSIANTGGGYSLFGNEPVAPVGQGRAYGVELFAQKRLTKHLYGIASYTLFWSEFTGLDTATGRPTPTFRPSAWDNRHLLSLTGGWRFGRGGSWEVSAKLRMLGPTPFTPVDTLASLALYPITGESQPNYARANTEQTAWAYQLDVRAEKRWSFARWSLVLYLDIQNATGSENRGPDNFTLARAADGSFVRPYAPRFLPNVNSTVLPTLGIRVRF